MTTLDGFGETCDDTDELLFNVFVGCNELIVEFVLVVVVAFLFVSGIFCKAAHNCCRTKGTLFVPNVKKTFLKWRKIKDYLSTYFINLIDKKLYITICMI